MFQWNDRDISDFGQNRKFDVTIHDSERQIADFSQKMGKNASAKPSSFRLRFCKDFNPRITPIFANFSQCFHIREDSRGLADKKVFI